jgi:hypothetical protein
MVHALRDVTVPWCFLDPCSVKKKEGARKRRKKETIVNKKEGL